MRKTVRMTAGEAVVKFLDNQYVAMKINGIVIETKFIEYFYTIFGHGCVLGVGEALSLSEHTMKVMQGKNEQGMAHAAISYAKMNNRLKIIPCMSSIGPGAANMVTAAATATVNNIPLLLILGDTFATRQPDPVLQQIENPADLTVTTNDAFKAVSRFFDRITRPEQIMTSLINAMRVLTDSANTGAAVIAMCQDVQGESFEYAEDFFKKRIHYISRALPDSFEIKRAAEIIRKAQKPLMIIGGGARYSFAGNSVIKFCEKFNIPFAETQAGKSVVKSSHPLNLGGIGITGNLCANKIAREADIIIGVGTRFTDFTTSSKWFYPDIPVLTINTSAFHALKLDAIAITADAVKGLNALFAELEGYTSAYKNEIKQAKSLWEKEMEKLCAISYCDNFIPLNTVRESDSMEGFIKATCGEICQTSAIGLIRKIVPKDAIAVGAAGSLPGCLQRMWTTEAIGSYNMEYGYSCMGYEIAGAFGAKLAQPDKEVYAFTGDGSYNMLHSEMLTSLQEKKKINILLFDNASYGCINNLQMGQGVESLCTELRYRENGKPIKSGEFMNIDYAMSAKGYGFITYTAKTMEELENALKDSLEQEKSTLIDIKVLPKTMTDGYGSWWNTGCSDNPRTERGFTALATKKFNLNKSRQY